MPSATSSSVNRRVCTRAFQLYSPASYPWVVTASSAENHTALSLPPPTNDVTWTFVIVACGLPPAMNCSSSLADAPGRMSMALAEHDRLGIEHRLEIRLRVVGERRNLRFEERSRTLRGSLRVRASS